MRTDLDALLRQRARAEAEGKKEDVARLDRKIAELSSGRGERAVFSDPKVSRR